MSRESTITDLRAQARQLEAKKRDIDKQVEAVYTTLRVFEQNGEVHRSRGSSYAQELTNAMYDILVTERPLHRSIIFERVQDRGIHVGGQKPVNTIGTYLSIDERFRNVGKGTWTLRVEPQAMPEPDIGANADETAQHTEPIPH